MSDSAPHASPGPPPGPVAAASPAPVIALSDPVADDESLAGAKAANLARCAAAGLRVLPGFVLTTEGATSGLHDPEVAAGLRDHWERAGAGDTTFVVRSSSTIEDAGGSSMAGQFTSVLDVVGWEPFLDAVDKVLASGLAVVDRGGGARPMAVLVQRQLDARMGGVMFGVDPVTGDHDHLVVEVVGGRPDQLVGGEVTAAHYLLTRQGAVVGSTGADTAPPLTPRLRRHLAEVARQALSHFRRAQDIEWAVDRDDVLWVLQSRPVTAVAEIGDAALLGPGPVAETFPHPLSGLEASLWVDPLRDGIVMALRLTGAASDAHLERSPVLTTVGGWAAVDLDLLGLTGGHASFWERFSPASLVRHVAVSWRVGRTRVALPRLGAALLVQVDEHLSAVPTLDVLDRAALADLVDRARVELATVHAAEVLCGMLLHHEPPSPPTGAVALAELARARAAGLDDAAIVAAHPVVLALCAPSTAPATSSATAGRSTLPDAVGAPPAAAVTAAGSPAGVDDLGLRDGLRLRTRWLQELVGRAAMALAGRLVADGALGSDTRARHLRWEELRAMAYGEPAPADLDQRALTPPGAPLPAAFRLMGDGTVLAEPRHGRGRRGTGRRGTGRHRDAGGPQASRPVGAGRSAPPVTGRPTTTTPAGGCW